MDLRLLTQDTACDDQGSGSASEFPEKHILAGES